MEHNIFITIFRYILAYVTKIGPIALLAFIIYWLVEGRANAKERKDKARRQEFLYEIGYSKRPPKSRKDWLATLLLAIFLGEIGLHRFYVGKIGTGILWLFTLGLCGIGWLVDVIVIVCGNFTDSYGLKIEAK